MPDVFVLMLGMTYRYIYLLLRLTNDMFLSRRSRVVAQLVRRQTINGSWPPSRAPSLPSLWT